MERHRSHYSVDAMCRVLKVSRSGFYAQCGRPLSARAMRHQRLVEQIRMIHQASRETYGAPRVHAELADNGERCGKNTVAQLMRREGIVPKTVRKFRAAGAARKTCPAPNLLAQRFKATRPDARWVTDVTYIPTAQGWLYLAAIVDLYSRAAVGWAMESRLTQQLTRNALGMALMRRRPPRRLLIHSDQGSEYAGRDYRAVLEDAGIRCSMSRKGNCWDNAVMERFFATLKTELVHHESYRTRDEARTSVFQYIEGFYNRRRRHSYLNYQAPLVYESNN